MCYIFIVENLKTFYYHKDNKNNPLPTVNMYYLCYENGIFWLLIFSGYLESSVSISYVIRYFFHLNFNTA